MWRASRITSVVSLRRSSGRETSNRETIRKRAGAQARTLCPQRRSVHAVAVASQIDWITCITPVISLVKCAARRRSHQSYGMRPEPVLVRRDADGTLISAPERGRNSPPIVECGQIEHAPHPSAASDGGDTVLGQGTTVGESQTMTLMITTGQSTQTPALHSSPTSERCCRPGSLPPCVRPIRKRAEPGRHRRHSHGHNRTDRQPPCGYVASVP